MSTTGQPVAPVFVRRGSKLVAYPLASPVIYARAVSGVVNFPPHVPLVFNAPPAGPDFEPSPGAFVVGVPQAGFAADPGSLEGEGTLALFPNPSRRVFEVAPETLEVLGKLHALADAISRLEEGEAKRAVRAAYFELHAALVGPK